MSQKKQSFVMSAILALAFICIETKAQLAVSTSMTPTQLVQNVLVGGGVSVSNITYTGAVNSIGNFTNGNTTNLGLNNGVMLCTGPVDASNLQPSIGSAVSNFLSYAQATAGDADLNTITGGNSSQDASVLAFDFIPLSDTVKFRYVFASEEYPEFVCSSFNDVFGFFISGPGITGPYTGGAKNIALIPGTTLPVAINSVNNGTVGTNGTSGGCISQAYSSYYVDNEAMGGTSIVFDGFTTVLTAWSVVIPCSTYHIKLVVADVGDGIYDSGVFLEENSFSTNGLTMETSFSNTTWGNNCVEGCVDGIVTFTLGSPSATPTIINYTIGGTAVNGTDYVTIPNSITIPAGADTACLIIHPILDGITEGTETITFTINSSSCGIPQVITLPIIDNTPVIPTASADANICPGISTTLTVSATGGLTPYTYNWSGSAGSGASVTVSPSVTTTYTVTAYDVCGGSGTDAVVVSINGSLSISVNNPTICAGVNTTLTATGATNYNWSTGAATASITVNPMITTTYTVTGTTSGCSGTAISTVTVGAPYTLNTSSTDEHCGHADGTATVTPTGGTGPFNFLWSGGQSTPSINNLTTGTYTVTVTDAGGCQITASATINSIVGPSAPFGTIVNETCSSGNGSVSVSPVNGTTPYTFLWSNGLSSQTINNLDAGSYTVTVTDQNGCTAINTTSITNSPPPVLSLIDTTSAICGMTNGSAQINIIGGTNPVSYFWSNGQTTLDLTNVIGGNYTLIASDANSCKDTITVTIGIVGGPIPVTVSTDAICDQNNGTANVTATGGSGVYTYQWSNGQSGSSISNLAPGSYSVTVDDGNCFSTSQVTIGNIPGPTAGFTYSPSIVTLEEPVFSFFDNSQGAISWEWNFGDGSSSVTQNSQHMYTSAGSYTVTQIVTNADGCVDSTTSIVIVKEIVALWVPNAFTPNQNGINEFFTPKGIGLDPNNFELYIYNRWGELIFNSNNLSYQWDGTYKGNEVPQDVYVWVIYYKGLDDIRYKRSGHVSVLK